jgi:hypothetical protein
MQPLGGMCKQVPVLVDRAAMVPGQKIICAEAPSISERCLSPDVFCSR